MERPTVNQSLRVRLTGEYLLSKIDLIKYFTIPKIFKDRLTGCTHSRRYDIQHNVTQHKDIKHLTTLIIMTA
jgi:hypothetical protein